MEKVKNAIINHKKQIIIATVIVGGAVVAVVVSKKGGARYPFSESSIGQEGMVLTAPVDAGVKAGDVVKIVGETKKTVKAVKVAAAV